MNTRFRHSLLTRMLFPVIAATPAIALAAGAANVDHTAKADGSSSQASATTFPRDVGSDADSMWQKLDKNRDGQVTRAEFNRYHDTGMAGHRANAKTSTKGNDASQGMREVRASDLIGTDVRGQGGQDIGEIKDLLVDVQDGSVQKAILSHGGVAGIGDQLFEYPLTAFRSSGSNDELMLNVSQKQLDAAKGFDRDNWPDWAQTADRPPSAAGHPNVWRATRLIGRDVADRNGEHLGEIADLVINRRSGNVDYAILQYDRPWSLDNPTVALPLKSFNFGDGRHQISMNVDKHAIDQQVRASADPSYGNVVVERWIFLTPVSTANGASPGSTQDRQAMASAEQSSNLAPPTRTTVQFDQLDSNHDGQLSRGEYQDATQTAQSYSAVDRNEDGKVTRQEFAHAATSSASGAAGATR